MRPYDGPYEALAFVREALAGIAEVPVCPEPLTTDDRAMARTLDEIRSLAEADVEPWL